MNAHPVMLLQLRKANNVEYTFLEIYVNDRDTILQQLIECCGCDRKRAKCLFIRLLYFGSFNGWLQEDPEISALNISTNLQRFIKNFTNEISRIGRKILDANPQIFKEVKDNKSAKQITHYNETGSVVAYFLQEYEVRVLECVYNYCCEKGYIRFVSLYNKDYPVVVLCADGIMLEKDLVSSTIGRELNAIVKSTIGFDLEFSRKPMDEDHSLEYIKNHQLDISSLNKSKLNRFDKSYFLTLSQYNLKKLYFEYFICKVLKPNVIFIFIERDRLDEEIVFYSQEDLKKAFNELCSGIKNEKGKETKFIVEWLNDENIKVYSKCDFIPYNEDCDYDISPYVFNLFRGFNPRCYLKTFQTPELIEELLKPFHSLG